MSELIETTNTIGLTLTQLPPNQEKAELNENALSSDMSDDDFVVAVDQNIRRCDEYWEPLQLKRRQETNNRYWIGDQLDLSRIPEDLEKGVENNIFRNLENFIPIATSRTPEVTVTPAFKNEQTRGFAADVKRSIQTEWETKQDMQFLMGRGIRNHNIFLLGVFQMGYDPDIDEFWTEEIPAANVKISKDGKFLAKYIKDQTLGDLLEMFPDKRADILHELGINQSATLTKKMLMSPVEYIEAWTDEVVGWKFMTKCLGKTKNPHFDYSGRDIPVSTSMIDPMTGQPMMSSQTVKYNHFKKPKMPFLYLTYWNRGIHIFDDTTLIEQGIGPQDWINKRKRQIGQNADVTNGHWVTSGDYISKEEFDKLEGGISEKIWLEQGIPADGLQLITGQPLPDYIFNDLVDSRNALNSIMGTDAPTIGQRSENPTATQDIMQRDQNFTRIDGYIRDGIERLARHWYEWMYHLYLIYRTDETSIAIPEDSDFENENVIFSRDRVPLVQKNDGTIIPVPMVVRVKQGSTLPRDEAADFARAREMKDVLYPGDYFKLMGMPNPRELTKNLLIWQSDPYSFFQDDPQIQEMLERKAKAAAMVAQHEQDQAAGAAMKQVQDEEAKNNPELPKPDGSDTVVPTGQGPVPADQPLDPNSSSAEGMARAMRDMMDKGELPQELAAQIMG